MWYSVKITVDEAGQKFSRRHVDIALLDLVVDEVIQAHRQNIECWRFHRRYGPQEFKVDVFCPNQASAQNIQNAIANHTFVGEMRTAAIVTDVQRNSGSTQREDIGEPSWTQEFRHVWPEFAQAQSEMQLHLVKILRENSPNHRTKDEVMSSGLNDRLEFYSGIQSQIDNSWGKQGSHAFIHHLHSFFGYAPFQSHLGTSYIIHDIR